MALPKRIMNSLETQLAKLKEKEAAILAKIAEREKALQFELEGIRGEIKRTEDFIKLNSAEAPAPGLQAQAGGEPLVAEQAG